jgi:hypothetical protein
MWPGVKAWFGVGYGEHPEEFRDLVDVESSNQAWEEDVQMKGFGMLPVKNQGQAVSYAGQVQGYVSRYTHVSYALGFIVTFEEMLNNLYPKLARSRAKALGFSKRQTKEYVTANVYNRAHTSGYTGGDGQVLCVTTHPSANGNQANCLSTAADISEVCLEDIWILIAAATDDAGLRIGLQAQSLHVHRNDWFEANRILKSTLQSETSNNAVNALRSTNAFPKGIKMNHYFTDTDSVLARTNCPDAMKMYLRHDYDLKQDNDFDTENAKAKTYTYFSVGWSDWRGVYSNGGGA